MIDFKLSLMNYMPSLINFDFFGTLSIVNRYKLINMHFFFFRELILLNKGFVTSCKFNELWLENGFINNLLFRLMTKFTTHLGSQNSDMGPSELTN